MIKKILLGLAAVIIILCIVIAFQPKEFRVTRSALIAAPPATLFEWTNDHRKFMEWSPWAKVDPNVKNTFSGPASGVGAACSWAGNSDIGEGTCTITESRPGELVRCRMDWLKPMEGTSTVDYTFKQEGDKTRVTWAMYGENNFMAKAVSLVIDCDKMCGDQFEKGLESLRLLAEAPAKK